MRPYTLTHLATNTDITKYVISIDKFTDADVLYRMNTAQLMLSTLAGRFITETYGGETPLLRHLDDLKLEFKRGTDTYSRILFIHTLHPQESVSGNQIQLELIGREGYLDNMIIPGRWTFITIKDLVKNIVKYYNGQRGSAQAELVYSVNGVETLDFPDYPLGTFDFESGITVLEALRTMVGRLQLPISAGGSGDLYSLVFEDHPTDNSKLVLKMFSQGSATTTKDTINAHDAHAKITRTYETYDSNIVVLRGQQGSGSMPPNLSEWTGKIEEYDNIPVWRNDIFYAAGYYTNYKGIIYKCLVTTIPGHSPDNPQIWQVVTKNQYVGTNFEYSPWTKNLANSYLDYTMSPGNEFGTNYNSPAFVDSNLLVRDETTWQDECIMRIKSLEDIPEQYLYSPKIPNTPITDRVYEGMKFIIDPQLGTIQAPFTGRDKYDRLYRNALVQLDRDGDWLVEKEAERGDQIAVRSEGKMYEYQRDFDIGDAIETRKTNTDGTLTWKDASETPRTNHCFHFPESVENVSGLVDDIGGIHRTNSAIRIRYSFDNAVGGAEVWRDIFEREILNRDFTFNINFLWSKQYQSLGWWATLFEAPFPTSTYYNTSRNVGDVYGGDIDSKVPVVSASNQNLTPTGQIGYTASDANNLGELDGIAFRLNFEAFITPHDGDGGAFRRPLKGDIPFRCTIYDTGGNVWIRDFGVRFFGITQEFVLLFNEFQIYRARAPKGTITTLENILTPELLTLEIPERRKIKRITIQMHDVYDEHGRFDPGGAYLDWYERAFIQLLPILTLDHVGVIDAFRFVKSPIAVEKRSEASVYHLMSAIQDVPGISNVEQLKKTALAQSDLNLHPNDVFTIEMPFSVFKKPGESFYLNHKYLVDANEKPDPNDINETLDNTRELTVLSVNYVDSKDIGAKQQIEVIKRI